MCTMYQMYEPVENMLLARDSYLPQYSLTLCNMEAEAKLVYDAVNSMLTPDILFQVGVLFNARYGLKV